MNTWGIIHLLAWWNKWELDEKIDLLPAMEANMHKSLQADANKKQTKVTVETTLLHYNNTI